MIVGATFLHIVLAEGDSGPYWVCVQREENPDWLQVVARFANKDRADQYAEIENHMAEDDPKDLRQDLGVGQPAIALPLSALRRIVAAVITGPSEHASLEEQEPEGSIEHIAEAQLEPAPEPEPEEAPEPEVDEEPPQPEPAEEEEPEEEPETFPAKRPAPNGSTAPGLVAKHVAEDSLSPNERKVLSAMLAKAVGDIAQMSVASISQAAGVPLGSAYPVILSLEAKGCIAQQSRGEAGNPARYKILQAVAA